MNTEKVYVNRPAVDWLTLTTWNYRQWIMLTEYLRDNVEHTKPQTAHKMQYAGSRWWTEGGSLFQGIGDQRGASHCIIEVSGALANDVKRLIDRCISINIDEWTCTRMDVQVTRPVPEWDAVGLFNAAKERGHTVGWASSRDHDYGELATVYIGSKRSGRFARFYQKPVNGEVHIRGEIVFRKSGGSDSLFKRTWGEETNYTLANSYSGSLAALKCPELRPLEVDARPELPEVFHRETKTIKWLRETVLPTFKRVVSQHDGASSEIAMEFANCIRQCKHPSWEWLDEVFHSG